MEKLERLPSWLRWILTPITVVISFVLIGLISQGFVWFQSKMLGLGDDAWLEKIWFNILAPAVTGYFTIMAGVLVAPSHKKIVSLVCGALIVMLGGISLLSLLGRGDWWGILNVIATVSGIGGAIYTTFEDVSN
jgi:hypothetical protein